MQPNEPKFPCCRCNLPTSLYLLNCQHCGRAALTQRELQIVGLIEELIGGNIPSMAMLNLETLPVIEAISSRILKELKQEN